MCSLNLHICTPYIIHTYISPHSGLLGNENDIYDCWYCPSMYQPTCLINEQIHEMRITTYLRITHLICPLLFLPIPKRFHLKFEACFYCITIYCLLFPLCFHYLALYVVVQKLFTYILNAPKQNKNIVLKKTLMFNICQ